MPQNLKTKPDEVPDDLPILSPEEEAFVAAVVDGRGYSEAYRIAYGAEGYSASSLAVKASRKVHSPKIKAHLRAIQAVGLAKIGLSREDRIRQRLALAARAEAAGNYGAAVQANDHIDGLLGLKGGTVDDPNRNVDPMDMLRDIAREAPDTARVLAAELRIDWQDIDASKRTLN